MNRRKTTGRLFVLSAPSGSGKTTLVEALRKRRPQLARSISATTRPRRAGERNGRDYKFLSQAQFERLKREGGFLEWARILGNQYGTPRAPIERALAQGKDVFLSVDIQGARQIRRSALPATTIFLLPPSLAALKRRLQGRGTETPAQIRQRLKLAKRELKEVKKYDYSVVNDRLSQAVRQVEAIVKETHGSSKG